jgi:Flp pilus assembly protein TadG
MRRVTRHEDRGAAAIIVAIVAPFLILAAAFTLDGGRAYVGRREVQNSADAAALAMALDCSKGAVACGATATADPYKKPGSTVQSATCNISAGSCTVAMSKVITSTFTIGKTGPVSRSATAKWSALNTATGVFPITIATCAVGGVAFGQKVTFHAHSFGGCSNPSGQFGWTDINCSAPSSVTVGVGLGIGGTTGNTPKSCTDTQLDSFVGKDVLVPVWDPNVTACGKTYCLTTFAQFHLTGWSGNGAAHFGAPPSTLKKQCDASADGDLNYNENTPCIRGYFVKFTTETGQFGSGACNTATSLFACRVYLYS